MKITEAIKEVGRPVQFYPSLARVFGIEEAIFIGQFLYWKGKEKSRRGIKKTSEEIKIETALTYKQQKRIKQKLQENGCIKYEYDRMNHDTYYKIFERRINNIYQEHSTKGHMPKGTKAQYQRDIGIVPKVLSFNKHRVLHRVPIYLSKPGLQVNKSIELFKIVNPSYRELFKNKTQRSACDRLLKKWTLNQLATIVKNVLPTLNADKYSKGKSITPLELEKNLGYIKSYIESKKNNKYKAKML